MPINFPNSPSLNDLYSYDNKTWEWNGIYWEVYSALTSYITSAYTAGDGVSDISGVTNGNLVLKSFSGVNITIIDNGNKLTFSGSSGNITGGGTSNYLPKWSGSTSLVDSLVYDSSTGVTIGTGFTWNNTNSRLGIGTTSPTYKFEVRDTGSSSVTHFLGFKNDNNDYGGITIGSGSGQNLTIQQNTGYGYLATSGFRIGSSNGVIWTNNGSIFRIVDPATEATNYLRIANTTGNVLINTGTDAGYKLDVNGSVRVNTNLWVNNIFAQTSQNLTLEPGSSSNYVRIKASHGLSDSIVIDSDFSAATISSEYYVLKINPAFAPTSGNSVKNYLGLTPIINQLSGASGVTRGVYVNPTLTSAYDFRAIETTAGSVLFRNGNIRLMYVNPSGNGNVIIGNTTIDRGDKLQVEGSVRVGSVLLTNTIYPLQNANLLISAAWADSTQVVIETITNKAQVLIVRPGANLTLTSGTHDTQRITHTFQPTGGNASINGLTLNQTINQLSGASGTTRGIYINPTISAATDFRAIETTVGNVVLNSVSGNTLIGTTVNTGNFKLNVSGDTLIQGGLTANTISATSVSSPFTTGSVIFQGSSGTLSQNNSNLFWDNVNNRLGIGTNSPSQVLQVVGGGIFSSSINISGGFVMSEAGNVHTFTAPVTNRTIRFITNSQSYSLFPTGNFAIGTTTDAGYKLDVNGTSRFSGNLELNAGNNGRIFINNVYPQILFGKTGTPSWSFFVDTENAGQFEIGTGAGFPYNTFSSRIHISTGGNVGIGTIPSYKLDVAGTARISGDTIIQGSTVLSNANGLLVRNANNVHGLSVTNDSEIRLGKNQLFYFNDISSGGYQFTTIASNSGVSISNTAAASRPISFSMNTGEILRIHQNYTSIVTNNFLIGTTTDAGYKLDVNGTARISAQLTVSTPVGGNPVVGSFIGVNAASSPFIELRNTGTVNAQIGGLNGGGLLLNVGTTERMRIDSSGNVGIGTPSPSQKLQVSGNTLLQGSLTATTKTTIGSEGDISCALLQMASTTQGVLFPRMTNTQRTSISSPVAGLMVYCTDSPEGLFIYKSTGWVQII